MASFDDFDAVVRRETPAVSRYAASLMRDRHLAEDVVQETFLRAWRYWESYRGSSNRQAWLITICRNVAFDALRRRRPETSFDNVDHLRGDNDRGWVELTDSLLALSIEHREVLTLIDLLGYDYDTAAEILDCPVGTVRSRLSRAREKYRDVLRESA